MNILDCPEELILYIFVPSNISKIFNNTNWLFACKKLYNLQNKLIDKGCVKNDMAVCKIIDIILKLRFNNIDYVNLKTYTKLIFHSQLRTSNIYFNDKILSSYVNSLIQSLAKHIFNRLGSYKKDSKNVMIKNIRNILIWIISYNEMLEIKINQQISQSKINMLKGCIIDNIIKSETITYITKESRFDLIHQNYFSYDVQEKIEIMCIKNGKFIISVTNMFNSIVGNNSRIRIKDIETKDYNKFVENDYSSDDDDYYDDYYCEIGYYDEVTRFFIEQYTKEYQKINHFY